MGIGKGRRLRWGKIMIEFFGMMIESFKMMIESFEMIIEF